MRNNNLINNCTLSEEFVDEETQRVFSFAGRDHFVRVLVRFVPMSSYGVGLYTCELYTFLVGFHRQSLLILIQLAVLWVVTGTAFYSTLKIQMQLRAHAWFVGFIEDCWKVALDVTVGRVWLGLQSVSIYDDAFLV